MKKLSEFVKESQIDFVTKELFEHLYIHLAFNNIQRHSFYTFESIGLFDGCKELVAYIIDDIQIANIDFSKYNSIDKPLKISTKDIINNCFVEEIRISFSKTSNKSLEAKYILGFDDEEKDLEYDKQRWDGKQFKFIDIKFYISKYDISTTSFAEMLTHELVHAWWDYIIRTKTASTLRKDYNKYDLSEEFKKLRTIIEDVKIGEYKQYTNTENLNRADEYLEILDTIDAIVYRLNKFEIESYIAQLNGALHNKKYDHIEDAIEEIKKTAVYQNYSYIYNLAVIQKCDPIKKLCKEKTCRKLTYLANKAWKKIINHLWHICSDHINEDAFKHCSNNYLITEQIKRIWRRN